MTAELAMVLTELRRHRVAAYRLDAERVRLIPKASVTPELLALVRRTKPALLPLLPPLPVSLPVIDYEAIYAALVADAGTADDLAAIGRHVDLNGFWVAEELSALDRRCDRLARAGADESTYRAAVLVLVARVDELRRWHTGTVLASTARRLDVVDIQPLPGPITLPDGTLVAHVSRFLGRLLTAADYVLARPDEATDGLLGVYFAQLAALGLEARVEVIH